MKRYEQMLNVKTVFFKMKILVFVITARRKLDEQKITPDINITNAYTKWKFILNYVLKTAKRYAHDLTLHHYRW